MTDSGMPSCVRTGRLMAWPSVPTVIVAPNDVAIEWVTRNSIRFEVLDETVSMPCPHDGQLTGFYRANLNSKCMPVNNYSNSRCKTAY